MRNIIPLYWGNSLNPLGSEFGWSRSSIAAVQTIARVTEALWLPQGYQQNTGTAVHSESSPELGDMNIKVRKNRQ